MGAPIPDGQYYGEVCRTRRVADLVLSKTRYAGGATVPWHAHASPLLCLVVRGAFEERSRGRSRTLGAGAVLFHPEDEPHAHRFEATHTRCFTVQLGPGWLAGAAPGERLRLGGPRDQPRGRLAWLARQLHDEFGQGADASALVLEGLPLAVIGELTRRTPREDTGRPAWVGRARELVETRLREPLCLTELAAELGVRPAHLSRTFRRAFGVSPVELRTPAAGGAGVRRAGERPRRAARAGGAGSRIRGPEPPLPELPPRHGADAGRVAAAPMNRLSYSM